MSFQVRAPVSVPMLYCRRTTPYRPAYVLRGIMRTARGILKRLGWPVDDMSDRQITRELYRRWFASCTDDMDEEAPLSAASAWGIIVSMSSEGNLDALCWSGNDRIPPEDVGCSENKKLFMGSGSDVLPREDRRKSRREPARDLVRWCLSGVEGSSTGTGWLIDRSAEGMAFIAPADEAPHPGDEILPSIHSREHGIVEAGPATIIRTESLNEELTLVCVHLLDPK